ncbi:MAG: uroporphyrinogen-III synthase [Alphaproteobacteria bacterium]|nr:uroporphyrinogen-III synthase [Alphaproteobacteria bacterium]
MSARILVTRSHPQCLATARRLTDLDFHPIVEPLFDLEPIDADIPDFSALAFTSANGVRAFERLSRRRDVTAFCVGARTAETAQGARFADVVSADSHVPGLAALIRAKLETGARLLHVGNQESRGDLAGGLREAGLDARFVAIYRAVPAERPGPNLARHLLGEPRFEAVLVHSPRASAVLAGFLAAADSAAPIDAAAISEASAAPLRPFARRLAVAISPDEPALLSAMRLLVLS